LEGEEHRHQADRAFDCRREQGRARRNHGRCAEEVVRDPPLPTAVVSEQLGARHEKEAPTHPPSAHVLGAIRLLQRLPDFVAAKVHVREPRFRRPRIVRAIPAPPTPRDEMLLAPQRHVVARHHAAGEEVTAHPVAVVAHFERIRRAAMSEHVHEEESSGREPRAHAAKRFGPVAQVLEHLDRDHAVEPRIGLEIVDVARDHFQVRAALGGRLGLYEGALRTGVRHAANPAARIALCHPQTERPPTASQLEDALAIRERSVLAGRLQRRVLGRVEVVDAIGPPAAAVFAVAAEHCPEECRRHFVVLLVRLVRQQCNGRVAKGCDERVRKHGGARRIIRSYLAQALAQQLADAGANDSIRKHPALGPLDSPTRHRHPASLRSPRGIRIAARNGSRAATRGEHCLARANAIVARATGGRCQCARRRAPSQIRESDTPGPIAQGGLIREVVRGIGDETEKSTTPGGGGCATAVEPGHHGEHDEPATYSA
jgi:hypothetical protein